MFSLARYQAEAGGSPYKAITYYHHAISLDPTKGISKNLFYVVICFMSAMNVSITTLCRMLVNNDSASNDVEFQ